MTDPAKLYTELIAAFNAGHWHHARSLVTALLPFAPGHAGVYGIAGVVSMELQQAIQAADYLRRATELDPTRADFATLHAKALATLGYWDATLKAADKAFELSSDDPASLDVLGIIYVKAQAHVQAVAAFTRAIDLSPTRASLHFNLANSLVALSQGDDAELALQKSITLDPHYWPAYLLRSHIKRQTAANNHLAQLRLLLNQHGKHIEAAIHLNMALAKEFEDLAEYAPAFDHLVRGKTAAKFTRAYTIDQDVILFDTLMQTFSQPDSTPIRNTVDAPIFIVGMPRSGTTLAERILTSHPDVCAAGELQNFAMALQRASGCDAPLLLFPETIVDVVRTLNWDQLADDYLTSVRQSSWTEPRFVDKLPHNFLYAGFIAKTFPAARIICLRRDPMDTCLGNFRQLFDRSTATFDYSTDLLNAGRYFVLFDALMAHWQQVFPGRILEIHYEDLVNQQEATVRKMLDFCELSWNDACLHFENNPAPVATFSAMQVRSPLYRSSLRRWKHYEAQAAELKTLLMDAGITIDI